MKCFQKSSDTQTDKMIHRDAPLLKIIGTVKVHLNSIIVCLVSSNPVRNFLCSVIMEDNLEKTGVVLDIRYPAGYPAKLINK